MENQLVVLPAEVAQIAENVSVEKRNEVQLVLNHVFNGVSKMREQLDNVVVSDINDKVNMKLANTIRLGVRQVRLEAEKTFDAKRSEVQAQMISFKTEDQLWLKAKQTMQILTKEIEENARWKEETKERFESEQKELKTQKRMLRVSKVSPEFYRSEFENMSDESFEIFISGLEKIEAEKIEAERMAEAERIAREKAEAEEREKIRLENERLKKEAEERSIRDKKRNNELRPYIIFIRDYSKMLTLSEDEYIKELSEIKIGAEQHWEFERTEAIRKQAEEEKREKQLQEERVKAEAEKAKLESELKARKEAEEKEKKEVEAKLIAERKAKEEAEKKAKNAPDKTKLIELALQIDAFILPETKSEEAQKIISDTKKLLSKVSLFIREKTKDI